MIYPHRRIAFGLGCHFFRRDCKIFVSFGILHMPVIHVCKSLKISPITPVLTLRHLPRLMPSTSRFSLFYIILYLTKKETQQKLRGIVYWLCNASCVFDRSR